MLPSENRMRRSGDFRDAVRSGVRAGRPTLVLHLAPGRATGPVLAGLVVNRAVGGSVTRNRVRRRLRPLLAERLGRVPAGARLVVRALPAAATADSSTLAGDLDAALERVSVRAGGPVPSGGGR